MSGEGGLPWAPQTEELTRLGERRSRRLPDPGTAYGNPGGGDMKDEWGAMAGRAALRSLD